MMLSLLKPNLLFSNFECCVSKSSLFILFNMDFSRRLSLKAIIFSYVCIMGSCFAFCFGKAGLGSDERKVVNLKSYLD